MTASDDVQKTILRNKLLGRWAAERLGITGRDADAYSDALACDTTDPERCDVFTKIRRDFDAAGVVESDDRILQVMTELMLKAGNLMPTARGDSSDAATVAIARNLMSR
ncbi:ATPase inhibitor subunit zeta [Microvirga sp. 2YAF29]|uniref:ATPase inhibitor subunit zeta n=1 Tax=Microvirga sp. 2YAF29 TaxID=3233031 RepID=UPI003F9A6A47